MGSFVICVFRPKPDGEEQLLSLLREHMPTLQSQDLITDRPAYIMRAGDGSIVEIFEWKSEDAAIAAHGNPVVRDLWNRFEQCCSYAALNSLEEVTRPFPHFEPVDL